jgi:hypothetical protein
VHSTRTIAAHFDGTDSLPGPPTMRIAVSTVQ